MPESSACGFAGSQLPGERRNLSCYDNEITGQG